MNRVKLNSEGKTLNEHANPMTEKRRCLIFSLFIITLFACWLTAFKDT